MSLTAGFREFRRLGRELPIIYHYGVHGLSNALGRKYFIFPVLKSLRVMSATEKEPLETFSCLSLEIFLLYLPVDQLQWSPDAVSDFPPSAPQSDFLSTAHHPCLQLILLGLNFPFHFQLRNCIPP